MKSDKTNSSTAGAAPIAPGQPVPSATDDGSHASGLLRIERHDHDGGHIAYEVWLNGGGFLFSIYEDGDFDAKTTAKRIVAACNALAPLEQATAGNPTPEPLAMRDYIDKLTRFFIDNPQWVALAHEARSYVGLMKPEGGDGR